MLLLQLIAAGQRAGFSLEELRVLLPGDLAQSRAQLVELLAQIENKPSDMDCAANARRVLPGMATLLTT